MKKLFVLSSLLLFIISSAISQTAVLDLTEKRVQESSKSKIHEELYLPSGDGLSLFSLGFKNVMADVLWFRTINYFGREFAGDQDYRFLIHYVNLVVDLNPRMDFVYQFGSMMFAWELKDPKQSIALLTKGIYALPENWLLRYYRGFMYFYFFKDNDKAIEDFKIAALNINAHPMIARLAEKLDRESALETLSETTGDVALKSFLHSKQ
jgi:hypothetical protein